MAKKSQLGLRDLKKEIADLARSFHTLQNEDLYTIWFLRAYITDNVESAAKAITNGPGDKGVDAVFVDDKSSVVVLVQAKYRKSLGTKSEKAADVYSFADLAYDLASPSSEVFKENLGDAEAVTLT